MVANLNTQFAKDLDKGEVAQALLLLVVSLAVAAVLTVLVKLILRCLKSSKHCCCACARKLCQKLKNSLMYNSVLRYWLMSFLSFVIACFLQLRLAWSTEGSLNSLDSIMSLCVLIGFLLMATFFTCFLIKNKGRLKDLNFKQSYGTLYTACAINRGNLPLVFVVVFCVRRLAVASIIAFLGDRPLLQFLITAVLCHIVLLWHVKVWPMESRL